MITNMGLFVDEWPTGVGCDASGVVEKVGENAVEKFKVGDYICGCTRLGIREYGTAQEYV
jgi:NADPH:quinone reductase-like Zn-dependent oxidoreductase